MKYPSVETQRLCKKLIPILKKQGVLRAGLFGSAARGRLRAGSDIDIVIQTHPKMGLFGMIALKQDLEIAVHRSIDIVEYRAIKPVLLAGIMRDHLLLV